jgi:polyisoprenyl-phosphate glycosyltransferase
MMNKKLISIVTPVYNESSNINYIRQDVLNVMRDLKSYEHEHIFIDNASTDNTLILLKELAKEDKRVKIIRNNRNFGHIRSPYYGLLQTKGDVVTIISADGQDPPSLIKDFVKEWEHGAKVVVGVKVNSKENFLRFNLRKGYYKILSRLSDVPLVENFMGFGLYDRIVIDKLKEIDDPYPYLRGLVSELGYSTSRVEYYQPKRKNGKSHNNFYTIFDIALLGITNNTKVPLRVATILGFCFSTVSFIVGIVYLIYKLLNWGSFEVGLAPMVIGMSFLGGIQILFLGLLGEYIGAIYTQVLHRPLVIEKERINFD